MPSLKIVSKHDIDCWNEYFYANEADFAWYVLSCEHNTLIDESSIDVFDVWFPTPPANRDEDIPAKAIVRWMNSPPDFKEECQSVNSMSTFLYMLTDVYFVT